MHRCTRAEIAMLYAVAARVGTPLNAAAVAFLESEQDQLGLGYDGRLWVSGVGEITKYPCDHILRALRRAYRQWRELRGSRDGMTWMGERDRWGADGRPLE